MNPIRKRPLNTLGYGFIPPDFLPEGKDEYYLRNLQNRSGISYRNLSAHEIEKLVRNNNTSDNWNNIWVAEAFSPELVKNCSFFGLVRIGKLEPVFLEYHNVCLPVGLYNSTIISCDFGDNVVVSNVNYMAHYIVGNEVMISNVHELHTTSHAKFGNGIIKEGEDESVRIWLEVRNENAGRKILPFNGMLPGDAFLWSRYREDAGLLDRFREFTEQRFDRRRGYYGKIGDRTVIKNTSIIKDVWIGTDAYIKGANKLKNLTIDSEPEARTQIGEGCEIVNGIIGIGCRVFYGAKAVRFIMASYSQLKYGARLINSYLGNNATISCCEVLNSLIYPAHEQHHNNSFLCAALVMGQSNMAAGATVGSNHNSRAADGEIIAGRGFWPGLCVSLKHNSRFASFTLLAKGDYPVELDISLPFSLVSNDTAADRLVLMPAYWFLYNMYALARNAAKYVDRDKRTDKFPLIEYHYLAPDTMNEVMDGIAHLERLAVAAAGKQVADDAANRRLGATLLMDPATTSLELTDAPFENSRRTVVIQKAHQAYLVYRELVTLYFIEQLCAWATSNPDKGLAELNAMLAPQARKKWQNVGGQLIMEEDLDKLISAIHSGAIKGWGQVHRFYAERADQYEVQKLQHAYACIVELDGLDSAALNQGQLAARSKAALATKSWMTANIYKSREKDYQNRFRKMVYDNQEQMDDVVGALEDNSFIRQQTDALETFKASVERLVQQLR